MEAERRETIVYSTLYNQRLSEEFEIIHRVAVFYLVLSVLK